GSALRRRTKRRLPRCRSTAACASCQAAYRRAASTPDMCLTTVDKSFIAKRYAGRGETMAKPTASFAALPIAYVVLRLLIVVNWLTGAAILALLVIMPNERWIMAA